MDDQSPIFRLAALGPFFAVDFHPRHAVPDGPWQPLTGLLRREGVRKRIHQIRGALATTVESEPAEVPWRVAASVTQLGLAARLISPNLGMLALGLGGRNVGAGQMWWQPVVGGPVPLSLSQDALMPGPPHAGLLSGAVRTLTELFAAESVSPRVLWGNVASAINGAYNAMTSVRPELTAAAKMHVLDALDHPLLEGMSNSRPGPGFRRDSCCLIYRLGSAVHGGQERQLCGDCVLQAATSITG